MSEKFGLDWKKYDYKRMSKFVTIMFAEGEREKERQEKAEGKSQSSKFR